MKECEPHAPPSKRLVHRDKDRISHAVAQLPHRRAAVREQQAKDRAQCRPGGDRPARVIGHAVRIGEGHVVKGAYDWRGLDRTTVAAQPPAKVVLVHAAPQITSASGLGGETTRDDGGEPTKTGDLAPRCSPVDERTQHRYAECELVGDRPSRLVRITGQPRTRRQPQRPVADAEAVARGEGVLEVAQWASRWGLPGFEALPCRRERVAIKAHPHVQTMLLDALAVVCVAAGRPFAAQTPALLVNRDVVAAPKRVGARQGMGHADSRTASTEHGDATLHRARLSAR